MCVFTQGPGSVGVVPHSALIEKGKWDSWLMSNVLINFKVECVKFNMEN